MESVNALKDWLDEHIDDYVDLQGDVVTVSYSVDTNKMAEDIIKFIASPPK